MHFPVGHGGTVLVKLPILDYGLDIIDTCWVQTRRVTSMWRIYVVTLYSFQYVPFYSDLITKNASFLDS